MTPPIRLRSLSGKNGAAVEVKHCHCEPARTLVWQSVFLYSYKSTASSLVHCPEAHGFVEYLCLFCIVSHQLNLVHILILFQQGFHKFCTNALTLIPRMYDNILNKQN